MSSIIDPKRDINEVDTYEFPGAESQSPMKDPDDRPDFRQSMKDFDPRLTHEQQDYAGKIIFPD